MREWSFYEDYVCTKMYVYHYIIKKEHNCREMLIHNLALKIDKSKETIAAKLSNIAYMVYYLELQKNKEISPLEHASQQNFTALCQLLFEYKICFNYALFTNLYNKIIN